MPDGTYTNRTRNTAALGYIRISAGKQRDMYVHTLVAMAKIGRALHPWETVEHIDGDRQNNHPDNLAVMSRRDNTIAMLKRNNSPLQVRLADALADSFIETMARFKVEFERGIAVELMYAFVDGIEEKEITLP